MKPFLIALLALLAADAATAQRLVANSNYEASGTSPGWRLGIGDHIVLRFAPDQDGFVVVQNFPRARRRTVDGVRRWESRTAGGSIMVIEARESPCTQGGETFRDSVTITQSERRLTGCGGPRLRNPAPQP